MEYAQVLTQAIMQSGIEIVKAAVQAMSEAGGPAKRITAAVTAPKISQPALRQLPFNWKAQDIYKNAIFEVELKYIHDQELWYM